MTATAAPSTNGRFPTTASIADAAHWYIDHQLSPIPLPHRSKDPRDTVGSGWETFRLRDHDLVERWFPAGQPRNVGLMLGLEEGPRIGDVDLDTPEAIRAARYFLPATGMVAGRETAPRSHWFYLVPDALHRTSQFNDPVRGGPGKKRLVELRLSGQTVVPPSCHEDTAEAIEWVGGRVEPAEVRVEVLLTAVRRIAAAALLARYWPGKGTRHDAALALAGGLLRNGWTVEDADNFIAAVSDAAQDPEVRDRTATVQSTKDKLDAGEHVRGWPVLAEALGADGTLIIRSVCDWLGIVGKAVKTQQAASRPRTIPPYTPFPTEVLPGVAAGYVRECAAALGTDAAIVALPVLAVMGGCIGYTRVVKVRRKWIEPAVVWTCVVSDSGTLKTPGYNLAVEHLHSIQRERFDEYRQAMEAHREELAQRKKGKPKGEAGDADDGAPPEPPVFSRVMAGDITVEKLADVLDDNPRGLLVARDELAGWLGSFTRYKGKQGGTDLPNWLEMHRAGPVQVDRKSGDKRSIYVPHAAVSVTGGIQPGTLARALSPEFLDAGLAARLLMAMPPKVAKRWSETDVSETAEAAYNQVIDRLLALRFETARDGTPAPLVLELSADAKRLWIEFYNQWAVEQAQSEGELAAAFSKLEGYAARFALIHHVVTHVALEADDHREIGTRSLEAGIALCRWFAQEARRIYATLSETSEQREARRLVEFIAVRGGRITVKDLQRSNSRKYPDRDSAEADLQKLVDVRCGRWEDGAKPARGGRRLRWFILHPTTDVSDDCSDDPEDGDGGTTDHRSDHRPPPPTKPGENGQSSETSVVGQSTNDTTTAPQDGTPQDRSSEPVVGHPASSTPFTVVSRAEQLGAVLSCIQQTEVVALDLETTGLDPHQDRARLLSLAVETTGGDHVYVIDLAAVDPSPLWPALAETTVLGHNIAFDLGFLARIGFTPVAVADTMLMSKLVYAGRIAEKHTLKSCCQRELGMALDKTEQTSDWSAALTPEQLRYAALDAAVLRPLYAKLRAQVESAGLTEVCDIEHRCLPGWTWLAATGVEVDRAGWRALAEEAEAEQQRLRDELAAAVPLRSGEFFAGGWNWDSPAQVQQALGLLGVEVEKTDDDTLAQIDHPFAALLRRYRALGKRTGTYGRDWLKYIGQDGRVHAGWHQMGSDAGRTSCRSPNLQQVPRDRRYRDCLRAADGYALVKADYSQIELRIAAKIAGEKKMLDAYQRGLDLHTLTAQQVLGKTEVTKADRQTAKSLNFGLLFGMSAKGFRVYALSNYGVELSLAQAEQLRNAFFAAYPDLAAWHRRVKAERAKETRTLAGRRRLMDDKTPDTHRLNSPVQGTGADGLKLALALLWERRHDCQEARPVLAVHDEIVLEAPADQADAAAAWLKAAMVDAMAPLVDPVPVEVEVKVGRTWAGD